MISSSIYAKQFSQLLKPNYMNNVICSFSKFPSRFKFQFRSYLSNLSNGPKPLQICQHSRSKKLPNLTVLYQLQFLSQTRYASAPTAQPPKQIPRRIRSQFYLWLGIGFAIPVAALLVGLNYFYQQYLDELLQRGTSPSSSGQADLGGDWDLVDHNGNACSNKDFHGKWCLVYFGFTRCPDVCPTELSKMVEAVELIRKMKVKMPDPVMLMLTVDPLRDPPEVMKRYCADFSPELIGMTGTPEQVARAARAFRVYFMKQASDPRSHDDYLMDHSAITYLVGPDGRYVDHYGANLSAAQVAGGIALHMNERELKQGASSGGSGSRTQQRPPFTDWLRARFGF